MGAAGPCAAGPCAAAPLHYELYKDLRRSTCRPALALALALALTLTLPLALAPGSLLRSRIRRGSLTGCFHQALNLIGWNFVLFEFTVRDVIKCSFKTSHNGHGLLLFEIVVLRFKNTCLFCPSRHSI